VTWRSLNILLAVGFGRTARAASGLARMLPFLGLLVTGIVAMWFVARLARENRDLRRQSEELARKLRML
jgi:hypothetical protein